MRAHLIPFAAGSAAASPAATTAACRLDAEDGSGWVLALTDDLEAPFEVEHLDARAGGTGTSAAVVEFDGPRDAAQVAADRRASRDRIGPAAMQVQGALGAVVLRGGDGTMVTVAFVDAPAVLRVTAGPAQPDGPDHHHLAGEVVMKGLLCARDLAVDLVDPDDLDDLDGGAQVRATATLDRRLVGITGSRLLVRRRLAVQVDAVLHAPGA